jgi:hypothetical protein
VPILLVAGSYLGTISHTLTALHVLAQRNLDIAAVVVSESTVPGATLEETVATITRFADPATPPSPASVPSLPSPASGGGLGRGRGKGRRFDVIGLPRLSGNASTHPAVARIAALL